MIPQDTPSALGRRQAMGGHPRRWVPVQPPVWPAGVVVAGVLSEDPQVPFTDDQQLI